jgi:hypothetical protein
MRSADPPPRPDHGQVDSSIGNRSRWPLVLLDFGIGVAAVLWIGGMILYVGHDHPGGFIDDEGFVGAANILCRDTRAALPPPAGVSATLEDRARTLDIITIRFSALIDDLADVPVAASDEVEVAWWIARWRQFLAIGPEYAAAIRTGNRDVFTSIGDLGDAPARDVNDFASRNGLKACVF